MRKRFLTTFFGRIHDRNVEMAVTRSDTPPVINETKYEDWIEVFVDGKPAFAMRKSLYTHYDPVDMSAD